MLESQTKNLQSKTLVCIFQYMCTMHLLWIEIAQSEFLWCAIRCKYDEVSSGVLVRFNCLKQRFKISSSKTLKQQRNALLFIFSLHRKKCYMSIHLGDISEVLISNQLNAYLNMMNACSETIKNILLYYCLLDGCVSGWPPETRWVCPVLVWWRSGVGSHCHQNPPKF